MQRDISKTKRTVTTIGNVENIVGNTLDSFEKRMTDNTRSIVNEAIDNLAVIVAKGFSDVHTEIREFKAEMNEFKAEMREFKTDMLQFKTEMLGFKGEMTEFKTSLMEFKNGAEPVLFSLKTDMIDVKRRLGRVETGIVELKEEATSSRIAVIGILKEHENRLVELDK